MTKIDSRRKRQTVYRNVSIYDGITIGEIKLKDVPDDAYLDVEKDYGYDNDCYINLSFCWSESETDEEYAKRMTKLDKQIEKEKVNKAKNAEAARKRQETIARKKKEKDMQELERFKNEYPELFK